MRVGREWESGKVQWLDFPVSEMVVRGCKDRVLDGPASGGGGSKGRN